MVGKGVLMECLKHPEVESVLVINRRPLGTKHPKLTEIVHANFNDLSAIAGKLAGFDACFYCVGVVSLRITEDEYHQITHDLTVYIAATLLEINPGLTFIYISGWGSDNREKSRVMRMRVKGKTENSLLALPSGKCYMFRPGYIQPRDGIKSRTTAYRLMYSLFAPLYPLLKSLFPKIVTSTRHVGKAMIAVALNGYPRKIAENRDITELARKARDLL